MRKAMGPRASAVFAWAVFLFLFVQIVLLVLLGRFRKDEGTDIPD